MHLCGGGHVCAGRTSRWTARRSAISSATGSSGPSSTRPGQVRTFGHKEKVGLEGSTGGPSTRGFRFTWMASVSGSLADGGDDAYCNLQTSSTGDSCDFGATGHLCQLTQAFPSVLVCPPFSPSCGDLFSPLPVVMPWCIRGSDGCDADLERGAVARGDADDPGGSQGGRRAATATWRR